PVCAPKATCTRSSPSSTPRATSASLLAFSSPTISSACWISDMSFVLYLSAARPEFLARRHTRRQFVVTVIGRRHRTTVEAVCLGSKAVHVRNVHAAFPLEQHVAGFIDDERVLSV